MSELRIAKRYATALLVHADELGIVDDIHRDVKQILEVFKANRQLQLIAENPEVHLAKKRTVFTRVFENMVDDLSMRFIQMLIYKRRENYLKPAFEEFVQLYNKKKGISRATLITSRPVSEATVAKIRQMVARATQTQVEMQTSEDASLIGGFLLRYGDNMVDASVKYRLRQINKKLVNNR